MSKYSVMANRAVGIPSTIDFVPSTGYYPMGHEWPAVINKAKQIPYSLPLFGDTLGNYYSAASNKPEKIFRKTFSVNKNGHAQIMGYCHYLPGIFNDRRIIDVTGLYQATFDIKMPNVFNADCGEMAYLSSAIREKWVPIGWGKFSRITSYNVCYTKLLRKIDVVWCVVRRCLPKA